MLPTDMPSKRLAARTRYSAPPDPSILKTTVGRILEGRRSLSRVGQQDLGDPFNLQNRSIWCAGNPSLVQRRCVAVVGTREVSEHGAMRARKLGRELALRGIVVVSGLAKGVDTEALTSAMSTAGQVIAVIGTSLERAYPIENARLQEEIARHHLLCSPFEPGKRTFPSHFPERNRVMAALSDATVIVEASDTSGTLHQAAECVRLGRWLFIAKNVMDDPALKWPERFKDYDRARVLVELSDLLAVL